MELLRRVTPWPKVKPTVAQNDHGWLVEAASKPIETFMVNLWEKRDRVIPVQRTSLEAIPLLKRSGVEPDIIYLDTSHVYPDTLHEILAIKAAFPKAQLVGDDWQWGNNRRHRLPVQRSVKEFIAGNPGWTYVASGNGWALVPGTMPQRLASGPSQSARLVLSEQGHITAIVDQSGTYYERDLLNAIHAEQRKGVYVDVGAHQGNHAVFFALECPSTKVVAFEPNAEALGCLRETCRVNAITNKVEVVPKAVHATWTQVSMERDRAHEGGTIEAVRLDDAVKNLGPVAVIKVDVEGRDASVLESGIEVLKRDRPLIAAEAANDHDLSAIEAVLKPLGYVRGSRYCRTPTYIWRHE